MTRNETTFVVFLCVLGGFAAIPASEALAALVAFSAIVLRE